MLRQNSNSVVETETSNSCVFWKICCFQSISDYTLRMIRIVVV